MNSIIQNINQQRVPMYS